ncbi:IclR family transcriptional regulator C-terminal domain-containing protein [Variovorax sp. J22P168]|nr:IclR family transcriptional regulator C-terminal domain-containing protein [Variovorax sp. J22P168]MDM0015479.1 IclR family transcriptional regulator C-terminal domain-containing protein [Variovorax sp. J22P168]
MPQDRIDEHLPSGSIAKLSPHTVTERKALHAELALVRKRGWRFTNSELVAGLFGVAIPSPSAGGESTMGLNVSSIGEPWSVSHIERRVLPRLRACADRLKR